MRKRKDAPRIVENVTIGDMVAEGKAIVKQGERVIFVEGAVPGDVADLRLTRTKSNYAEAVVERLISPSPQRIEPFCQHFGTCGGCKWQNLAYEQQLFYKEKQVRDQIERIGKVAVAQWRPILGAEPTRYYRNKMDYTFSNRRWWTAADLAQREALGNQGDEKGLGFHIPRAFDKVLHIEECHLQGEPSNSLRNWVHTWAQNRGLDYANLKIQKGFLRNLIIRLARTGELMVIIQVFEEHPVLFELLNELYEAFPQITSLNYIVNSKLNDTWFDQEVICYKGQPFITETLEEFRFRISPKSFFQTNTPQAERLYQQVRELAALTGEEVVYDLYTGTGTIAQFVSPKAKRVVGLEYIQAAIDDAWKNAELNGISNCEFYAGDIKDLLTTRFFEEKGYPDVIITDPPRAGMHPDVVAQLLASGARRIVYVSCNPATQARDLALLDRLYEVKSVQPVDMFPQTYHVESIACLERRS